MNKRTPLNRLKHQVSGAIERGEKTAIECIPVTKHTKGPWKVLADSIELLNVHTNKKTIVDKFRIADETSELAGNILSEANARLIAAAPELLEACTNALKRLQDARKYGDDMQSSREVCYTDANLILRAAIAKAEGKDK